jgi:hypothetical protein
VVILNFQDFSTVGAAAGLAVSTGLAAGVSAAVFVLPVLVEPAELAELLESVLVSAAFSSFRSEAQLL